MKIAFEKLEAIVTADAKAPRQYERYRDDIFEEAMPMLYVAARHGEIELLDVLIACRHHADLTRLISKNFLMAGDIEYVKTVNAVMKQDVHEYVNRRPDNFVLEDWLKKSAG